MLTQMRKGASTWVAQGLILLLTASFAVWGVQGIFRFAQDRPVAVVGDIKIEQNVYANEVKRDVDRYRRAFGPSFDMNQARMMGLDRQVLQRLVGGALLDETAKAMGMVAGDGAVIRVIQKEQVFQGPTGFDRYQFEAVLRNNGYTEQGFLDLIRRDLLRQQIMGAVVATPPAPTAIAEPLFRRQREQRVARYVVIPPQAVGTIQPPAADVLETYHKDNAGRFTAPEYRTLRVLKLAAKDLAAGIAVSDEDLASAYEQRKDEFNVAEKRVMDQFVLTDAAKAADAAARLKAGEDFAKVAEAIAGIGAKDLSLGEITAADLPQAAATAAFAAKVGEVVGPVDTPLGTMFLRATKVTPGTNKPLAEVKGAIRDKIAQERATEGLYDLAKKVEDKRASGADLVATAKDLSLPLTEVAAIDRQGLDPKGRKVEGLPDDPRFITDAFQLEAGQDGDLAEAKDGTYYMIEVASVTPSAVKPLDSVRSEVLAAWTEEERSRRLTALTDEWMAKARAGAPLEAIAKALGSKVATGEPVTRDKPAGDLGPEIVAEMFKAKLQGLFAGPAVAGAGQIIGQLTDIVPVNLTREAAALLSAKTDLGKAIANDVAEQYQEALKARIGVAINDKMAAQAIGVTP